MVCLAVASLLISSDAKGTGTGERRILQSVLRRPLPGTALTKKKRMVESQVKTGNNKRSPKAGHRHAKHKTVLQGRVKEDGNKDWKRNPEGGGEGEPGKNESGIAVFFVMSLFAGLLWMCTDQTIRVMDVERQKNHRKGIKNIVAWFVTILNAVIERFLKTVEGNVSLAPGELHAKKIVTQDGTYQNYAYMGLGTKLKERLENQIEPINGLDTAVRDHDIVYTQFQQRLKNGETVTKQEVGDADEIFIREVIISKHDDMMNAFATTLVFLPKKHAEDTNLTSHTVFVV